MRIRFQLRTMLACLTVACGLAYVWSRASYYHRMPRSVELGAYNLDWNDARWSWHCNCEIQLTTHWSELLEQRLLARRDEVTRRVTSAVQVAWPVEELAPLKSDLRNRLNVVIGRVMGQELISSVSISRFSFQGEPLERSKPDK